MIISISGLDGAGKSTQIELLADHFRCKGLRVRVRHLIKGSLTYFFMHSIIGKFSGRTKAKMEQSIRKQDRGIAFHFLALIKKVLLVTELLYFNFRYGRLKRQGNDILICDRYFYDSIVQIEFLGIAGKMFLDLYRKFIIEPDLSIYMKVDPYTAYERKKEFDMDYFTKKTKLYENIFVESTVVIEPAGIEKVSEQIKEYVEQKFSC